MKMFTKAIEAKLIAKGYESNEAVCKIFNPYGKQTWVIFGADKDCPDLLFCVADLGMGCVEAGSILRSELEGLRIGRFGGTLERDAHFSHEGKPLEFFLGLGSLSGI